MKEVLIVIVVFFFMEFISWFTHKYIMHGFLWYLHKDHHQVDKDKVLQKNDSFFLIFAIPSMILIYLGYDDFSELFFIGLGIACYGFAYFLVHEVIIHQRIKMFKRINNRYIRAIRKAHKMHHKHLNKEDGESFGMLIVGKKYWK